MPIDIKRGKPHQHRHRDMNRHQNNGHPEKILRVSDHSLGDEDHPEPGQWSTKQRLRNLSLARHHCDDNNTITVNHIAMM